MNIKTVGFQVLSTGQLSAVQEKLQGVVEFLGNKHSEFDELSVVLKEIHKTTKNAHPLYELQVNLIKGSHVIHAKKEDRDVLVCLDEALDVVKTKAQHK
jgi:ribosome-associated translation inhibitor RaiA